MNRDPCAIALNNAIAEINKAYPDIKNSFIFTENGTTLTGDQETDQKTVSNIEESFENLKEAAKTIGNLKSFTITTKTGKLTLSNIEDMHLLLATSKNADKNHIHSITHVIIPTILKTMETLAPTQPQITPPKELIVDTLTGFFERDSVQIDPEILVDWNKNNDSQVKIETSGGNSTLCKVKEIIDQNMKGKNMIRIPEKLCKTLEINKGDMVKVEPAP
jgi:predicted regulator of Ras-like GTPase activity (Roadblock/LC7/MglB family)/translation initiation factor IF-1